MTKPPLGQPVGRGNCYDKLGLSNLIFFHGFYSGRTTPDTSQTRFGNLVDVTHNHSVSRVCWAVLVGSFELRSLKMVALDLVFLEIEDHPVIKVFVSLYHRDETINSSRPFKIEFQPHSDLTASFRFHWGNVFESKTTIFVGSWPL